MPFAETIRNIPFAPRTTTGAGFLPPILRAQGHILYLAACISDPDIEVGVPQALAELHHAREHWDARADTENVSLGTLTRADTINLALNEAIGEYEEWTDEQRIQNLRDLANRVVGFAADLDRELVGLTTSDPGSTL